MGANYDLLILAVKNHAEGLEHVKAYLFARALTVRSVGPLESAELLDDRLILLSPEIAGRVQLVATPSGLGLTRASWFNNNPLAIYLSLGLKYCLHLWSLDSGYAAGYAAYTDGSKAEADWVCLGCDTPTRELLDGVPIPEKQRSHVVSALLNMEYDFAGAVSQETSAEIALAGLVARFGFKAQLLDFYEIVDDMKGISIRDNKYEFVALFGWTAVRF